MANPKGFSLTGFLVETFLFFYVFALLFLDNFLSWVLGRYKRPLNLFMRRQFYAFQVLRTELWGLFTGRIQPLPDSDDNDSLEGEQDRRFEDYDNNRRPPPAPEPAREEAPPPSPPNANGPLPLAENHVGEGRHRRRHPARRGVGDNGDHDDLDDHGPPQHIIFGAGVELLADLLQFQDQANNGNREQEGGRVDAPNVDQQGNGGGEQNGNGDVDEGIGDVEIVAPRNVNVNGDRIVEQNGGIFERERIDVEENGGEVEVEQDGHANGEVVVGEGENNVDREERVDYVEENLIGERVPEDNENANGDRMAEQDEGIVDIEEQEKEDPNVEGNQAERNGKEAESKEVEQNEQKVGEEVNGKDESNGDRKEEALQRDEEKVEEKEETRHAANVENPQGTVEKEKAEEPGGSQANGSGSQRNGRQHSGGSTNGVNNGSGSPASKAKGKKSRTRKPRGGGHHSGNSGASSGQKRHLSPGDMMSDD